MMKSIAAYACLALFVASARAQLPTAATVLVNAADVTVSVEKKVPVGEYFAIGLSEDRKMPETAIAMCFGNNEAKEHYATTYVAVPTDWPATNVSYDGTACSITAPTEFEFGGSPSAATPVRPTKFNLLDGFVLHMAAGKLTSANQVTKHDMTGSLSCSASILGKITCT